MARLAPKSIRIETNYRLPNKEWQAQEAEQLEAAAERAKGESPGDAVGELLRWPRADGHAVYMVTKERPLTLAHVDVGDAYMVEGTLIRGLRLPEVRAMVERERKLRHYLEHMNDFYDELEVGSIVHYHNGFKEFVRCEVVEAPDDEACTHAKKGERCLKPLALVGGWSRREMQGDGYHVRRIREGSLFKPSASCIYENPEATHVRRHEDPSQMEALGVAGQQSLFG